MEKLKVYPIMLPTDRDGAFSQNGECWLWPRRKDYPGGPLTHQKHLYLVSDREIEEGDCFILTGVVHTYRGAKADDRLFRQKIIATTNKLLGLPLIPQSFIEEYVQKQGKIESVYIPMTELWDDSTTMRANPINCTITEGKRYIDILPTKDSWNREEIKEIRRAYGDYLLSRQKLAMRFDEWFDKNY